MRTNGADTNNVHVFGELDFWPRDLRGLHAALTIKSETQKSGAFDVTPDMVGVASSGGCCVIM